MSTAGSRKITEEEWLTHQHTLKQLYVEEGMTLKRVMETMESQYNFSPTKYQYEKQFKAWNLRKNWKKEEWLRLSVVEHEPGQQQEEPKVYISGKLLSCKKVHRQRTRYQPLSSRQQVRIGKAFQPSPLPPPSPTSVALPSDHVPSDPQSWTAELPFSSFELCLRIAKYLLGSSDFFDVSNAEDCTRVEPFAAAKRLRQLPSIDSDSTQHVSFDIRVQDNAILRILQPVVPQSIYEEHLSGGALMTPSSRVFTSPLHRLILFSVSNNFAGLGTFSMEDIIRFLQREADEKLYHMILQTPGYSSLAIAQNMFKGTVEVGDARIVNLLLTEKNTKIDVNQIYCCVGGERYTPIERAASCWHKDVVEILLRHNADVTKTYEARKFYNSGGAVNRAIEPSHLAGNHRRIDALVVGLLIKAGGDVSLRSMQILLDRREGELFRLIIAATAYKGTRKWRNWGLVSRAIQVLDEEDLLSMVKTLLGLIKDINRVPKHWARCRPHRLIDVAAQRGSLRIVHIFLDSGALLTDDTLPCAIKSGNEDLIRLLLDMGADVNSIGPQGITPLVAAFRVRSARIIKLIISCGASINLVHRANLSDMVRAASDMGSFKFIGGLIDRVTNIRSEDLGYALAAAIKNGRDELAMKLIDANAFVNACQFSYLGPDGIPLVQALKQRNALLVHKLLDAEAHPHCYEEMDECLHAIEIAAEWGDHSIVEALIFAGASIDGLNKALVIALRHKNRTLVQLLLDAGADINMSREHPPATTPLAVAVENDVGMARNLLHRGADPDDSMALENAIKHSKDIYTLLFQIYAARYPVVRKGFGSRSLALAVGRRDKAVVKDLLQRGVNADSMIETVSGYDFGSERKTITDLMNGSKSVAVNAFGLTILLSKDSSPELTELFLRRGCNPNGIVCKATGFTDEWSPLARVTALLAAIGTGNASTVKLLIRYGADINFATRGPVKRTPLQRAAEIGSGEIVELLLNRGANVNAPAALRAGGTALQLAAIGGYIPIACTLLSHKADVNAPASKLNGRTALEAAAEHGRLDMLQLLLNEGAGSARRERQEFTNAISLARDNGHFAVCDLLEDHLKLKYQGSEMGTLDEPDLNSLIMEDLRDRGEQGSETGPSDDGDVDDLSD